MDNSKYNILLVDDEEDLRELCSECFRAEGFEVDEASRGDDAFELIKSKSYHAIVSDSHMPGMSGEELLSKISALKKLDDGTLFYLCTGSYESKEEDIQAMGGAGVVMKPFDIEELINTVLQALERKKAS